MSFGIINWSILILLVIGITWLGHRLSAGQKGLDGFFLGGNSLPWWAVSGSIMATQISAVTIIALPGAVFQEGGNLLFLQGTLLGFVIAKILMTLLFVGPFYEKKIYSPYDFIGNRLGQRAAHLTRGLFLAGAILGHGVRLLTVSLVLSVIVDLSIGQSILFIGLFSVAWSIMGGITTVIWTDLLMFVIMVGGAIISIVTIAQGLPIGLSEAVAELDASAPRALDVELLCRGSTPGAAATASWSASICSSTIQAGCLGFAPNSSLMRCLCFVTRFLARSASSLSRSSSASSARTLAVASKFSARISASVRPSIRLGK
jgi:Na+/proline symporter